MLEGGVKGMKIGMVKEGFGRPESEAASDAKVRKAARALQEARRDRRGSLHSRCT